MSYRNLRIGYVPYGPDLQKTADRRRFCFWAAQRGVPVEIARPGDQHFDVIVLASTADLPAWTRSAGRGPKLVYELIDSYLEIDPKSPAARLRGVAKWVSRELSRPVRDYLAEIRRMCSVADAVVCATPEQAAVLSPLNGNVHEILDAHEELSHAPKGDYRAAEPFRLVWEGMGYTLHELHCLAPALAAIRRDRDLELHLVTDLEFPRFAGKLGVRRSVDIARSAVGDCILHQWSTSMLPVIATSCDLAVIGLDLANPMSLAKPESKLLLFWHLGIPAVVSATPAYRRVVEAAGSGLTCATDEDWESALRTMMADEDLRAAHGRRGLEYVDTHHDRDGLLARWDRLFDSLQC